MTKKTVEQEVEALADAILNQLREKHAQLGLKGLLAAVVLDHEPEERDFDDEVLGLSRSPGPLQERARSLEIAYSPYRHFCDECAYGTSKAIGNTARARFENPAIALVRAFRDGPTDEGRLRAIAAIDAVLAFYKTVASSPDLKRKSEGS